MAQDKVKKDKECMEYKTVSQIANSEKYPFTVGQLRSLILLRHKNGLNEAVRKIGRRLYFRVDLFEQWIESHAEANPF